MRSYLTGQLDGKVSDALHRGNGPQFQAGGGPGSVSIRQPPGTLIVIKPANSLSAAGGILGEEVNTATQLPAATVRRLLNKASDAKAQSAEVSGKTFRIESTTDPNGNVFVLGLPTDDIDHTLGNMIAWFALLTLLGVFAAGGAGTWLVRRQLKPLHDVAETAREVSAQNLSTGETTIHTRVAEGLTDTDTEVGQVGAALNTLLEHVDSALAARHRSEQQVRQFVADASHELRTPLSTIHGYAELSRRTPDDPGALATALNKVETEAGRMSALVEDLLLLARLDSGRPLVREDVDLTRLLLEAVADARVLAPDHHWRFDLPDEPVTATGDADRLHQVVTNLLNNARNHTPAGTTVTVRVQATPAGGVRIDVHDDGPGLPEDIAAAAFERFTRGDSSRTRASGGAGLGLSLVSAIAAAHGGTAGVVSRPGDTTFTVELP
ncbi:sensor histidine kinase [Nocardioides marmorisolisilvae]|uniref:histidine kinase n=2 Tax=Nocardioides marmorisolisilvae TaxID=1542737 RepID=A0A3N0DXU5_9ACTN|nr:sensor histidine kinase [Nocardioides marmorisolisilvae]